MVGIPKRKRSGGPRSEEGKSLASANAIKTGAYSSMVVLPNENEQDFLDLQDQFVLDFMPQYIAELSMVHELAAIIWKKLRLEKLEKSAFLAALNKPCTDLDLYMTGLRIPEQYNAYLANLEIFTEELIDQLKGYAIDINKFSTNPDKDEFMILCQASPGLFREIVAMAKQKFTFKDNDSDITPGLIFSLETYAGAGKVSFINYALKEIKEKAEAVAWIAKHLDRIRQAVFSHKERRLLELMQSQGVMRARDELSRAFYRTLSELRKQQSWRLKMTPIDVTLEE
jgi:hypothetical protein